MSRAEKKNKKGKKHKNKEKIEKNHSENFGDEEEVFGDQGVDMKEYYHQQWKDDDRSIRIPDGSELTIFDAVKRIDHRLARTAKKGRTTGLKNFLVVKIPLIGRHVPYGKISVGTSRGNPRIVGEGYYLRAGLGNKFGKLKPMNSRMIKANALTILNLKDNEVAIVVDETQTKVCYGPSQFVMLKPWIQVGDIVDLMGLKEEIYEFEYEKSVRALAIHVPEGKVAIIQINDDVDPLQIIKPGHYVKAEDGARFVKFIDVRNKEVNSKIKVKTKDGNEITWPITLSMQVNDPIAFHISGRKNAYDVIDDALIRAIAAYCANHNLNKIREMRNKGKSVYKELKEKIAKDREVCRLSEEHGVAIRTIIIGRFTLGDNAMKINRKTADDQLKIQNDLRQAELKKRAAIVKYEMETEERKLERSRVKDKAALEAEKSEHSAKLNQLKIAKKLELEEFQAREKAKLVLIEAEAKAKALELESNAKAQAILVEKNAEIKAMKDKMNMYKIACDEIGKDFVVEQMKKEFDSKTVIETFKNTEKMIIDPKFGVKGVYNFVNESKET